MSEDPVVLAVFAEFAEHAVPEAFESPTRARRVALEPPDVRGRRGQGVARFGAWVDARIVDALAATWPHDRPLVVAYTSDGRVLRRYDENGCGHHRCVTGLVCRELVDVAEPWVFGADLPRPQPYWDLVTDADGNEVDEVLRQPTETRWRMTWYAEGRSPGVGTTLAGVVEMDGEQEVGRWSLAPRSGITREFHRMLSRHPSRRRYPLRRR